MDPTRTDQGYLDGLANDLVKRVRRQPGHATHAMVQGEHVLTTVLVARLQDLGVRCYAATTQRLVEEAPDGSKVVRFVFRVFREYPPLRQVIAN